jgi:hypothetical protein
MNRLNDYYELTLAGHWLSALINGDETGLTDDESADLDAFMREYHSLPDLTISTSEDDESHFAIDAVSGLHADCYTIRFYFTNHALNPQQTALELN